MLNNQVFNATVCFIGIGIILIHIVNIVIKKNKRPDEKRLLAFLAFTAFHFLTYLTYTLIKVNYTSDAFTKVFYTFFYIFNNVELLLFFLYMISYVDFNKKLRNILIFLNYSLFLIFIILDLVNIFTGIFFTTDGGEYVRSNTMIISQGYQFIMLSVVFIVSLFNKKLVLREKIAFSLYCILPLVAIILQNAFKGYAIAYASILISIEIVLFFINVSKNIELANIEEKNKDAQIRVMMSQIQPHFIYNSLSAISTLITIDPPKAEKALDDFTEYLRHNLSSLTETNLIPFEDELKHIKTYISLEKIRFNDRVNVIYDIKVRDFYVPPLSIQPIVENAIKHGILKRLDGGIVTLKTYEDDDNYIIEVTDDGVGFDINSLDFNDNQHIGIANITHRLKTMGNGELKITSEVGNGVNVVITFNKEKK